MPARAALVGILSVLRERNDLLAVEQRLAALAIAAIVREHEGTVRRWLKRRIAEGVEGLKDRPMPTRTAKATAAYTAAYKE